MEKEVKLTQITAKFTKDFQTFGKMDPFVIFTIGKSQGKTETANDAGKEPAWKQTITLTYLDQKIMTVKAYEEDMTSNEYMGQGTLDLGILKLNGNIDIKIMGEGDQSVGTISCKYAVKSLQPSPLLIVKNIKVDLYKETRSILKAKPYFSVSCGQHNVSTETKEQSSSNFLNWNQSLRIKIKDNDLIVFKMLDKNDNDSNIFTYEALSHQFKTQSGHRKYSINDRKYEPFGILEFDYETMNYVNRQQSTKNQQKTKEEDNFLHKINIQKIKGDLTKEGADVFFHILMGTNKVRTDLIHSAKKDFIQELNIKFIAQNRERRITFALWDQNMISNFSNTIYACGHLPLPLTSEEKKVDMVDAEGNSMGCIYVTASSEKTTCRTIVFTDVKVKIEKSTDFIGTSDPYIIAKIGDWSVMTETGEGNQYTFRKNLELKFDKQDEIIFEIWDQDLDNNERVFRQTYKVSNFKEKKGQITLPLKSQGNSGSLYMKYITKNLKDDPSQPKTDRKKEEKSIPQRSKAPQKELPNINEQASPSKKELDKHAQDKSIEGKGTEGKGTEDKGTEGRGTEGRGTEGRGTEDKIGDKKSKPELTHQAKKSDKDFLKHRNELEKNENRSIEHSMVSHSKNTIRLPSIEPHNYGDKIFDKQSSSTLQKSIHVYSMPKQQRFGNGPKYQGQPSYYVDTCFKPNSGRGVGFGFGNKRQFPQWMERNMKQNPAPGAYFEQHSANITDSFRAKGPTFGISHKHYEKVTIPKEKKVVVSSQRLRPINP